MQNPGRRIGRLFAALVVLGILAGAGAAQAASSSLEQAIQAVASDGPRARAQLGVHVVAVRTGRVIYSRNATKKFMVASNEKLVTAATALDALGEGYRFRTSVYADGRLADGVLQGNLVLRGGGDPTIGGRYEEESASDIFRRWARVLKAKGIGRVAGDVVADDTFFDGVHRHPDWSDYPAWKWYYACVSGLAIDDNCVVVTVKPASAAPSLAVLSIDPPSAPVRLVNGCKTSAKRHSIWFDRAAGSEQVRVGGYVRLGTKGYSHQVAVARPSLHAAVAFGRALQAEGISVEGVARLRRSGEALPVLSNRPLCQRETELVPVLSTMLKRSHNHYAEQVIKTVGAETKGVGSWRAGLGRAAEMLRRLGFDESDFSLADGSGLSRGNRLTPSFVTGLLLHMEQSPYADTFRSLLAVAGQDGTLSGRLREEPYAGNVRAKTGYLNGVGALSGYATTRSGIRVAFSILVNDSKNAPGTYSMREMVDAICRAIVDYAE